ERREHGTQAPRAVGRAEKQKAHDDAQKKAADLSGKRGVDAHGTVRHVEEDAPHQESPVAEEGEPSGQGRDQTGGAHREKERKAKDDVRDGIENLSETRLL